MQVILDYTDALAETVGPEQGIPLAELQRGCDAAAVELQRLVLRLTSGEIGFAELPFRREIAAQSIRCADRLREFSDTLLVIGIGGSALGAQAVQDAMEISRKGLKWGNVLVLDNVDPEKTSAMLDRIDPARTAVNVVTKSGGTAETIANFLIVYDCFTRKLGRDDTRRRVVATTDPDKGMLREIADAEGFEVLPVPGNVGGRFSVLSPVGLFPAAYCGVDIDELLAGARGALDAVRQRRPRENPSLISAVLHVWMMRHRNRGIRVFFPYASALHGFAQWCCQLWAESLGKRTDRDGREIFCGQTPIVATGAVDQHSQVQLYMEGPHDKLITFFQVKEFRREARIPAVFADKPGCAYLANRSLNELIDAEKVGTTLALARAGRPSITLSLPTLSPLILGELFLLLEYETALAGEMLGINAFDQPGVEAGKKNTYALMGRPGYEELRDEILRSHASKRHTA